MKTPKQIKNNKNKCSSMPHPEKKGKSPAPQSSSTDGKMVSQKQDSQNESKVRKPSRSDNDKGRIRKDSIMGVSEGLNYS